MGSVIFGKELSAIDGLLLRMAVMVEEALRKAGHALATQELSLSKEVKKGDASIDDIQAAIEDAVIQTIATQQPVAADLRRLFAAMQLATDLERAGDYAVHLAKTVKFFSDEPAWRQTETLTRMAELGCSMIRGTAEAYANKDATAAKKTAALDDEIDHSHKQLIRDTLSLMMERPEEAERCAKILATSAHLERLGDHMTNACEAIVYMVEGARVELNE